MHNLNRVGSKPISHLDAIFESKREPAKSALAAVKPKVVSRYQVFSAALSPAKLGTVVTAKWTAEEKKALIGAYSGETKALAELKEAIHTRQTLGLRLLCPYCGISNSHQFDHYLPKEHFPEFAVHAHNLAPICGVCNTKKGATWLANGKRVFVNPYVDKLPADAVFSAVLNWTVKRGMLLPAVQFSLVRPAGMRLADFSLLQSHVDKLGLLDRFTEQAHSEYVALRDAAMAIGAENMPELRRKLRSYVTNRRATLGHLSWKLALYDAVIAEPRFLKECLAA